MSQREAETTSDALEILTQRYRGRHEWDDVLAEEDLRIRIGITVHTLRKEASLTQRQLARKMGITQPMLSQIENGDYDGGALDMLWRACKALHKELQVSCHEPGTVTSRCEVRAVPA